MISKNSYKTLPSGKVVYFNKLETASVEPPENAMKPKAKAKKLGGGWYELPSGKKVRKSELEEGD